MNSQPDTSAMHPATLQEAIDHIAAEMGYPSDFELTYTTADGETTTHITVHDESTTQTYELHYDATTDDEPTIRPTTPD
jgi:hypothetical protein